MDVFFTLDLIGTAVFAYTGSVAARQQRFHLLGVLYISLLTAVGGGTIRGLLLQTPELFWMKSSAYLIVVSAVVLASYLIKINTNRLWFYVLDSLSLAVFVALGIQQTLLQGQPFHIAFAMGVLTGIGGGLIRDAITSQPPQALSDPAYPLMIIAAAVGGVLAINMGFQAWTLACLAVLIVVLLTAAINYYRTGRPVNYERTPQRPGERSTASKHSPGFDRDRPAIHDAVPGRSRQGRQAKSGMMAFVHASMVIVLSCIAGFYYFNQSITDATANVTVINQGAGKPIAPASDSGSVPLDNRADEKIRYVADLQLIDELLTGRQLATAKQRIGVVRGNSFADHRLDALSARADDLGVYLSALDQADLALASNDTESLANSIALASSLGFTDHRLETLKVGLANSRERAAIEAASLNLAKNSFKLHLASAEHHLNLGNLDLAQAEIETARSFGINNQKLIKISEDINAAIAFDTTPMTDAEFTYAADRFKQLESAIKLRNINAITTLTSDNKQRLDIFNGLFDRYLEINASVIDLSSEVNSKVINATLALENMRLPNGNIAYPPSSYGEIKLSIQRTRQGWSKIVW